MSVNGDPRVREPLLELVDLNVWLPGPAGEPKHILRDVRFSLDRGDRFGLIGESGSGKTTTILSIMGLLPPGAEISGEIWFRGEEIAQGGEEVVAALRWSEIAMIFQGAMNALNPVQRVGDQISEALRFHRAATGGEADARVVELLELVGIPPARRRDYPHEFSGGMRQRLCIAMAVACKPALLLADEPTTALDAIVQAQVMELLMQLCDELGVCLILVTHDIPVVSACCHRAAVMHEGQVVETNTVGALYDAPEHEYTKMLYNSVPSLARRPDGRR
jgi:peptide/nickel transport system ATP-binding protein